MIDGEIESAWDIALWEPIDVPWRGDPQSGTRFKVPDSAEDFSGRYKAMWTPERLYLLVDITDDILNDAHPRPLSNYYNDDTVEIFIDEDNGREVYQGTGKAYAYHISIFGDVVDRNALLNDHIQVVIKEEGTRYIWEMEIMVVNEDFNIYYDAETNNAVELSVGKTLGFTASYIDNDGGSSRESFIGSVDSEGHHENRGYIDSSSFGTLTLVE